MGRTVYVVKIEVEVEFDGAPSGEQLSDFFGMTQNSMETWEGWGRVTQCDLVHQESMGTIHFGPAKK